MSGYKVFRSDRNFSKYRKKIVRGGGGVCAFVKESYKTKLIEKSNGSESKLLDYLLLEVHNGNSEFLIGTFYRHDSCDDMETQNTFGRVIELSLEYEHVMW